MKVNEMFITVYFSSGGGEAQFRMKRGDTRALETARCPDFPAHQ